MSASGSGENENWESEVSGREAFWGYLCSRMHEFWMMFTLGLLFMLLSTISVVFIPPGTASYYVSFQVLAISLVLVLCTGFVLWRCND
jgi:hypothetical protein